MGKVSLGAGRSSYTRTSTLGKFHQLFETQRGYDAMRAAGLEVKQKRTLENWLDGTSHPNKANTAAINQAYEDMRRGGVPKRAKKGIMSIFGLVAYGEDVRDRGNGRSPLRVDLSKGNWGHIEAALDQSDTNGVDWDELIAEELIEKDDNLGDSYPWGFPGGSYSVTISS